MAGFGKEMLNYCSSVTVGYKSGFVFGGFRVRISARRPADLVEVFRGFSQSLQDVAISVPQNKLLPLASIWFPKYVFTIALPSVYIIICAIGKASLNVSAWSYPLSRYVFAHS